MKRVYSNGRITVFWDSSKCIRAGMCDGQLPQVFNPRRRPWVDVNAADPETIKRVIDTCPSGALTYETPGEAKPPAAVVRLMEGGPYKISGPCCLLGEAGQVIETNGTFALCRCGRSKKAPFCDGTHLDK